jgi:hypothetical protein
VLRSRKYKSGSKWALWRWTDVESEYIVRLHVIKTPWFAICLHWFNKPDQEPHLHDHPVSFLSLILKGKYHEEREVFVEDYTLGFVGNENHSGWRRWWNYISASDKDRHRIDAIAPGTLTLCFMGPKTRDWGFHTPDGWVYWKDYNKTKYR